MYEVEQKYRLSDATAFERMAVALGVVWTREVRETDTYYRHPSRNFAETDEALRLREQTTHLLGKSARPEKRFFVTYKGPKLRAKTKTREETEILLSMADRLAWRKMLRALGFRPTKPVQKVRRKADWTWRNTPVEISWDNVAKVGAFVELEIVVSDLKEMAAAEKKILALAQRLGLRDVERRSYLELILEKDNDATS